MRKHPRHDYRAPVGLMLLKLGLSVAGTLINKKLADRAEAKREPNPPPPKRA